MLELRLAGNGSIDLSCRPIWIGNFNYELLEMLMLQLNHNRLFRMKHIPEYEATILVERPGPKHVRDVRAGQFQTLKATHCRLGIRIIL